MNPQPSLNLTFVREKDGQFEYGWIKSMGIGKDTFLPVGHAHSAEIAHARARQLMRLTVTQ